MCFSCRATPNRRSGAYRRAVELAPTADEFPSHLSRTLTRLRHYDEAKAVARTEPSERYRLVALAEACYGAGEQAEGERFTSELIAKYGADEASYVAQIMAQAGRLDEAFQWLERAYQSRSAGVAWIKTNIYLDPLHVDQRWPAFLKKLGLSDEQLK